MQFLKKYFLDVFNTSDKENLYLHTLIALSIIMVVYIHICIIQNLNQENLILFKIRENFYFALDILLALSGYFISTRLLLNQNNLKYFYINRFLKIVPIYYIAIFFYWYITQFEYNKLIHIQSLYHDEQFTLIINSFKTKLEYIWGDFLFISNYLPSRIVNVGWAISAIVQFYCILPILIFFRNKIKNPIWYWISLYCTVLLFRVLHFQQQYMVEKIYFMTHTRIDSFIIGVMIAELELFRKDIISYISSIWKKKWILYSFQIFISIQLYYIIFSDFYKIPVFQYIFKYNWYNIIIFLLMLYFITNSNNQGIFNRLFSLKIFTPISKISYTMFLFHEYFVYILLKNAKLIDSNNISSLVIIKFYIIVFIVTCILGYIFFLIFEKQFLMLKTKKRK